MFQSLASKMAALKLKLSKSKKDDAPDTPVNNAPADDTVQQVADEMVKAEEKEHKHQPLVHKKEVEDVSEEPRKKVSIVKIIIFLLLFIVLAAFGAGYYYISNIDWNQHKDKIAAEFSNITGKRIVFDGPVHLTLMPSPSLQAEDIKIFNPGEDLDEPLATVKSLVANLTLSSLLNGDFDVKMMSLVEPNLRFELLDNNLLNWDTPLTDAQRANLENMQITLDSVLVKNATIHWIDDIRKTNYTLNNVNAEVIAQSIFGPYRIEGTYIKNENPEGFAFSIGKITSGLATSVNAVINQPSTETFVRFDGSILSQNNAVNGNLIFESKKLMDFINSNSDKFKLKPEYDYPLAVTLELKSNKQKIELTNFAAKYGDSAGAGNLLIPLTAGEYKTAKQEKEFRPKVEFGFNFASLDLAPVKELFSEFWNKYKDGTASYNPQLNFDILADIKAVKASYNNQNIKDLKISTDVLNNKIVIRDFSAVLPGDASFSLTGDIYSDLNHLTFKLNPAFKTDEFRQTLSWLGITPSIAKDTLLRRVNAKTIVAGNFNKVGISSINLNLDNSVISGDIGVINDKNLSLYLNLKTTMFNVDDYFPETVVNNPDFSWAQNVDARFQKIMFNPDIYAELRLSADTVLYNSLPYTGVVLNGNLKQNILQLTSLQIDDFAGAKMDFKGQVKGFGKKAEVENLKFNMETKNFNEFVTKTGLSVPDVNMKKFNNFSAQGIITGFSDKLATKSIIKAENLSLDYGGLIELKDGAYQLNGNLELKSPDFVKMLNDFNFKYEPKTFVLGMFNMKSKVSGNLQKFSAQNLQFNIGSNTFQGSVVYDGSLSRPNIVTDLTINRLELDKFFYNHAKVASGKNKSFSPQAAEKVDFLERPIFDDEKFNFDFLTSFDFSGKFNVNRLSYRNFDFDYCKFKYDSKGNVAKLSDFEADFGGGKIKTDFELTMLSENPTIQGNINLENNEIIEKNFSGAKYGIKSGMLSLSARYSSIASSFADLYEKLRADGKFSLTNAVIKGWNIKDIYEDLLNRKRSQGLTSFIKNKLMAGNERFSSALGSFLIEGGRFSLSDSQWVGDGFKAYLNANASLVNWEGEAVFDVDFDAPDYLPNFKIIYTGPISVPELNINADDLAIMYNQRQQEIQAKEAAEKEAQKAKLRKELDNSLLKTKAMESELANVVRPDLSLKKQKAKTTDALDIYNNLEQRLSTIESDLAEILLVAQNPDITEDVIKDVDIRNDRNSKYIEELKKELHRVHLENLKSSIAEKRDFIVKQNEEAAQIGENYKTQKDALEKRLSLIVTSYSLENDETFSRLKNSLQGQILALSKLTEKVQNDYQNLEENNEFALDKFFREITALAEDSKKYVPEISSVFKQLFDYADERIKIAEEAYQKQKREEEIKKKLEENTGSISVKGTGVSKTVVRGLEEIEKSEEVLDNKNSQVLDFGGSTSLVVKKGDAKKNEISQSGQGVVKSSSGKISKASGVIIKK